MPLTIKPGVRCMGVNPEIVLALTVALGVFDRHGVDCVVTSLTEGRHRNASLHYVGAAVDLRTRHLPGGSRGAAAQAVGDQLRAALGEDFDVVVERDHIHLEFQPKSGANMPPIPNA